YFHIVVGFASQLFPGKDSMKKVYRRLSPPPLPLARGALPRKEWNEGRGKQTGLTDGKVLKMMVK
ncbi:MAG: hypothetical protein MJZ35_08550, partial [Bacteroidaceae bacterium]|nr:hypothetical protein [Bacteroidaceae bacterium]